MRINWKLRFKNKTVLVGLIGALIGFIYQVLGVLGVLAPISEDQAMQVLGLLMNVLVGLGVIVDPTTEGLSDSKRAQGYIKPM